MRNITTLRLPAILIFALLAEAAVADDAEIPVFTSQDIFDLEYAAEPRFSPDGATLIYTRWSNDIMSDRTQSALWSIDLATGGQRPLLERGDDSSSARWSPEGDRLAFIAPNNGRPQIHLLWLDSGQTAAVTNVEEAPLSLAWSPDGNWIAFTMRMPTKGIELAQPPAKPQGAEWADPVKLIDSVVYRFNGRGYLKPGNQHIFVVPAEGGSPRQLTTGEFDHQGPLAWTPDGSRILFSANRRPDWEFDRIERDVYAVSVQSGELTNLTGRKGAESSPSPSPDGRLVAYLGADDAALAYRTTRLHVMRPDGSDDRTLAGNLDRSINRFEWADDGRGLYVSYDDHGRRRISYIGLNGDIRDLVDNIGGTAISRPYVSGDFDISQSGTIAFTAGSASRPADIAVLGDGEVRTLTALNEDVLTQRRLGEVKEIVYRSALDQQEIQGWYITPPDFDPQDRYPLILEIHGGPHAAYGPHFSAEMQRYAAEGYVVFYDNHRGSSSYGEDFALLLQYKYSSSDDFADHMSGVDAMIEKGFIDPEQLYVTGGSAGGIASAYAIGLTDRFRAAAVAKPVINWISKTLTGDIYTYQIRHQFPGMPWEEFDHYWQRSPLSLVGNVTTPTLLITGEEDYRTPISETEQFYQALKLRGVETVMIRVPGASHAIAARPSHMIAKADNIIAWFDRHRGPEATAD